VEDDGPGRRSCVCLLGLRRGLSRRLFGGLGLLCDRLLDGRSTVLCRLVRRRLLVVSILLFPNRTGALTLEAGLREPARDAGFADAAREAGLADAARDAGFAALEAGLEAVAAAALLAGLALEAGLEAALLAGLGAALLAGFACTPVSTKQDDEGR
jgi:hypothetical protein